MPNNDDNEIRANLEEKFRQLLSDDVPPEEMKEEVFDTLDTLTLIGDIVDLFTAKFGQTENELLDLFQELDDPQEE